MAEYNKAPQVTRDRMYLDTMQQIISNTSKVLVDQKGGNNLLYLPLDKLMQMSGRARRRSTRAQAGRSRAAAIGADCRRRRVRATRCAAASGSHADEP